MPAPRFSALEVVFAVLVGVGGITTLAADRLGLETAKSVGIVIVFLGTVVFGLNMIVKRRADIGTRYSSIINASFHVFRGAGAIAWGAVFVVAGVLTLTGRSSPQQFVGEHTGVFVILAGLLVTAWGIGSASRATHRYRD